MRVRFLLLRIEKCSGWKQKIGRALIPILAVLGIVIYFMTPFTDWAVTFVMIVAPVTLGARSCIRCAPIVYHATVPDDSVSFLFILIPFVLISLRLALFFLRLAFIPQLITKQLNLIKFPTPDCIICESC
jgi:hypothetical protein